MQKYASVMGIHTESLRIPFTYVVFGILYLCMGCVENTSTMTTGGKNQTGEGVFGSADRGQKGWVGQIYRLPRDSKKIPIFDNLKSGGSIVTPLINIPPRSFSAGFPDVPDLVEWFGLQFKATLLIPEGGCHCEFALNSDDGSRLYIDDDLVVDNDGKHDPKKISGTARLKEGTHDIVVDYFQGPRDQLALQVFIKLNSNDSEIILPESMIDRPKEISQ